MATIRSCNKHNMIACVEKTAQNAAFYQVPFNCFEQAVRGDYSLTPSNVRSSHSIGRGKERTASSTRTADFQGTAESHDAASIPKSPNDFTPTDASQTSGGDEGLLDIYALEQGTHVPMRRINNIHFADDTADHDAVLLWM
ncbi:hypothetical protein Tco_0189985 [Tanacetum coccineum]